jgi:phage terminase small subunit
MRRKNNGKGKNNSIGDGDKLTPKEKMFIEEYTKNFNATQSFKKIYGASTDDVAGVLGHRMLKKVKIRSAVDEIINERLGALKLEGEEVVRELMKVAFADIRTLFREDGTLKDMNELSVDQQACIASVKSVKLYTGSGKDKVHIGTRKKIKFHNRLKALKHLLKYFACLRKIEVEQEQNFNLWISDEELKRFDPEDLIKLKQILGSKQKNLKV